MKNILLIIGILLFLLLESMIIYHVTEGKIFKKLWHDCFDHAIPDFRKDKIGFDGCSFTCVCKICGKKILQDSNGDWFHK